MGSDETGAALVYLLINKIQQLPEIAIASALRNSSLPIYIGYINEEDLVGLPKSTRISFVNLNEDSLSLSIVGKSGSYLSFDNDDFFALVQLKWTLFNRLMATTNHQMFVYSDLDVVWLRNFDKVFTLALSGNNSQILVQHFTNIPGIPQLCMGVFVFKNSDYVHGIVTSASDIHKNELQLNPRFGDDDVITRIYIQHDFPREIQLLPQNTFPVGNSMNLFSTKNIFPGLVPFEPYVFHANFVVGIRKKIALIWLILRYNQSSNIYFSKFSQIKVSGYVFLLKIFHFCRTAHQILKRRRQS